MQLWPMSEGENTAASWYEATRVASPQRPRLNFDLDVDVCVIGAGLAGLTVAREVARRGWSVAVLEANRVAWAASGRNTGFVLPGFHEDDRQHGRAHRARSRQAALGAVGARRRLCAAHDRGNRHARRRSGARLAARLEDRQRRRDRAARSSGCAGSAPMSRPGRRRACARCCRTRAISARCIFRGAFHIHPLNYALGLAADAEEAGARIFEDTPAVAIDPAGVRKRIDTPSARVRAAHVVLAGNVHLGDADAAAGARRCCRSPPSCW